MLCVYLSFHLPTVLTWTSQLGQGARGLRGIDQSFHPSVIPPSHQGVPQLKPFEQGAALQGLSIHSTSSQALPASSRRRRPGQGGQEREAGAMMPGPGS